MNAGSAGSEPEGVIEQAQRWLEVDPDPDTRAELEGLIAGPVEDLAIRFSGRLEFGTAGLRGELGAGPMRMNRVLVRMTAAALGRAIGASGGERVVIGYDARHKSDLFAQDTARVLAAQGFACHLFAFPVPTPALAFAVRCRRAAAGVMVTASHNPRADNGFKVYWSDGAQIVAPVDADISARIDASGLIGEADLAPPDDRAITAEAQSLIDEYVDAVVAVVHQHTPRDLRTVYTPVHGVGRDVLTDAMARAGFAPPIVVAEQGDPDPDFPTAAYPNPEEPGVLDLAIGLADREHADIVLANDPDADRLAVVVPDPGGWRRLSGDEIGWLLAEHLLSVGTGPDRIVATTIVSSRMLAAIAADHGVHYNETLTGFKWIMRTSIERPDLDFVFGYEEALGYAVGDTVRDKDGIGAALAFAELAAGAKAAGRSVVSLLDDLHRRHGVHATAQRSNRFEGPTARRAMTELMAGLRERPPSSIGESRVLAAIDLLGAESGLPPTDGIVFELDEATRLVVRPSGTEPKVKLYGEAVVPVVGGELGAARRVAEERLEAAMSAMSRLVEETS